jgi:hypothetical protein
MATTAEIAATMKPWVANWNALISVTSKYTKFNAPQPIPPGGKLSESQANLNLWFTTYIAPIYNQRGVEGSTINVTSITSRDQLLEQYRKLASELSGIFNQIGVFPGTSQLAFTRLNIVLAAFATFNENPPQSTVTPKQIKQAQPTGITKVNRLGQLVTQPRALP